MSGPKKRPLEDFFKPYGRTDVRLPQKRRSLSHSTNEEVTDVKKNEPKTPAKTVTFKDVTPKSTKSLLFSPHSAASLPIRSPRHDKHLSPTTGKRSSVSLNTDSLSPRDTYRIPSLKFSDVSGRTHKVFEGSKVIAVRDSDDDSESLESLDDIFGRKKDTTATSDSSPLEDVEAERVRSLSLFTNGRSVPIVGKDKLRALHAKDRAKKFDIGSILDDHYGDEEAQQNITLMRAGFDGAKDLDEDNQLDKKLLASVVKAGDTDQDDVDRLLSAVERTEALSSDRVFSFFKSANAVSNISPKQHVLPESAIPHQLWAPKDVETRTRMYLSGYMKELAFSNELSDEFLKWTYGQIVRETRTDLRNAYVQCLEASSKTWTRLNVTASDVCRLFRSLGADEDCIQDKSAIEAKYQPVINQPKDYSTLGSTLRLFRAISPDMDFVALSKLSSILLRITLDKSVMSDSEVCQDVESLMERLLSLPEEEARMHVCDHILTDATQRLLEPHLQVQLLSHILPTSRDAVILRKSLADVFLLGPSTLSGSPSRSNAMLGKLSTHVFESSSFSLTRHANSAAVDYSALTARTQILNVAVSSGDIPGYTASRDSTSELPSAKQSSDELKFNSLVDTFADQLHNLFTSIKDTGASHMRRTEAKDTLQALYFRLLFSVRTRPRKKKHVFDPSGEMKAGNTKARWFSGEEYREKERGGEFMKKFFAVHTVDTG